VEHQERFRDEPRGTVFVERVELGHIPSALFDTRHRDGDREVVGHVPVVVGGYPVAEWILSMLQSCCVTQRAANERAFVAIPTSQSEMLPGPQGCSSLVAMVQKRRLL
jgi:hypothetical protein